jgi:hypothetical protein
MKQKMIPQASAAQSPSPVRVLQFKGQLWLDPDPLANLLQAYGEDAAEDTVCRTLADIGTRLTELRTIHHMCRFADMMMPARRIAAISGQIGLTELALAATHVSDAARQGNGVALEATLGRLERCFDLAMTEVWSFQGAI